MLLEVEFESDGDELVGSHLQQIDVFRCGGYTIERARCSTIDAACLRSALGAAVGGAGQCANPSAWAAQRVQGPNRRARGQITDAKLMVWMDLTADERSGNTVGALRRVEFHSRLALEIDGAALPMSIESVQLRLRKEIERRLFDKLAERQLAQRVAEGVHRGVIVNIARAQLRGYYEMCIRDRPRTDLVIDSVSSAGGGIDVVVRNVGNAPNLLRCVLEASVSQYNPNISGPHKWEPNPGCHHLRKDIQTLMPGQRQVIRTCGYDAATIDRMTGLLVSVNVDHSCDPGRTENNTWSHRREPDAAYLRAAECARRPETCLRP